MSEMIWKCFRCNLSFKDEEVAEMHKEISNHSVTKRKVNSCLITKNFLNYCFLIKISAEGGIRTHELLREGISYFEDLESLSVDRASIPLQ